MRKCFIRWRRGGRDTDPLALDATDVANVDALWARYASNRADTVRRMLVDATQLSGGGHNDGADDVQGPASLMRRLTHAILERAPPCPPWTASIVVLVATEMAVRVRPPAPATDEAAADAAAECIACIQREFEAAERRCAAESLGAHIGLSVHAHPVVVVRVGVRPTRGAAAARVL